MTDVALVLAFVVVVWLALAACICGLTHVVTRPRRRA